MPKVPWQVRAVTRDILINTADLALFLVAFGAKVMVGGRSTKAVYAAGDFAQGLSVESMARGKPASPELYFEYLSIIRDDPFIPEPLLPEGWYGFEAHALARKNFSQMLKSPRQENST